MLHKQLTTLMVLLISVFISTTINSTNISADILNNKNFYEFKYVKRHTLSTYTVEDLSVFYHKDRVLIESAAKIIAFHEGFSAKPYKCPAGYWTQGFGRGIKDPSAPTISRKQAHYWLKEDIAKIIEKLDTNLPWWRKLNTARQEVLINLTYNVGESGIYKFKRFLSFLERGAYTKASKEILYSKNGKSKYWSQVGHRATHLAHVTQYGKWNIDTGSMYG